MNGVNGDGFKVEEDSKIPPICAVLCGNSNSGPQLLSAAQNSGPFAAIVLVWER